MSFEDKVVLVTGGGTGVGRAAALLFAERGARVALLGTRRDRLEETAAQVEKAGGKTMVCVADVRNAEQVAQAVRTVTNHFGALHVAFNNAGVEGAFGDLAELEEGDWDSTIAINLKGTWLSMKYELPAILASGGGAVVNNSTNLTQLGLAGTAIYTASKAGVDALTRVAAIEYGRRGVRVNAVGPGNIENTPMTHRLFDAKMVEAFKGNNPLGKLATAKDIAEAAVWLCSPGAGHINGQLLLVDGGLTLQ